ncbi:hypothetical protein B0T10DRAFT_105898 [Thelonectria olida]|uniref:Uncharacterized protein n=1 Tax=Thelonectria olida TaxID=1576542 RepID=A0A9P8WI07_9HYPO|nr:hypothetical protein B0T10DRAFT_105898 [Thelonectria olida]
MQIVSPSAKQAGDARGETGGWDKQNKDGRRFAACHLLFCRHIRMPCIFSLSSRYLINSRIRIPALTRSSTTRQQFTNTPIRITPDYEYNQCPPSNRGTLCISYEGDVCLEHSHISRLDWSWSQKLVSRGRLAWASWPELGEELLFLYLCRSLKVVKSGFRRAAGVKNKIHKNGRRRRRRRGRSREGQLVATAGVSWNILYSPR